VWREFEVSMMTSIATAAPVTRRSRNGCDNTAIHDEAIASKVCKIYNLYLKKRGWMARRGNKHSTWIFTYETDKVRGEKGMHYAEDYNELGTMIEKYGLDHKPVNPDFRYVGLLEKDRKSVTQIHDEVVAATLNASLISNDNKAKKPNSGVLKNGLDDDPSSNKKVAHPKDNNSRIGAVTDKRKVDNVGLPKISNDVTKKLKKNSPSTPVNAATIGIRVSMSPSSGNSSSLSPSLTPAEIVNVRDAAMERIILTDDDGTDLLNDLYAVYNGLHDPLKKALVDAVRIMTKKQVEPAQQLDPLIKIIKLQKTNEQKKG
jgi:hypothetical protein